MASNRKEGVEMRKHTWWIVFLFVLLGSSTAFGEVNFKDVVSFGDSLTHNDLLWVKYENPPDLYGRDPIHAVFNRGAASGNELWEYAVAGSESDHLEIQIGAYELARKLGRQDKATLINLEIGGNDIVNNDDLLAAHAPGENGSADEVIDNIIRNIRSAWKRLRDSHPDAQFVIWTITDTTRAPRLCESLTEEEASNIRAHTQRANKYIRTLDRNASVVVFDFYAVARRLITKPPELFGQPLVPPPDYGEYDCLFADKLHPTAVSNAILANGIIDGMNKKWNDSIPRYTNARLANLAHISH